MKWYVIFTSDYCFLPLKTGVSPEDKIWDIANSFAENNKGIFEHYDVLMFNSEREMIEHCCSVSKECYRGHKIC